MKFVHPEINRVFDLDNGFINTLIIESPDFFRKLLEDIHCQIDGEGGKSVISLNDTPVDFGKYAEILDIFVPFDINRKTLLTKIGTALEKNAFSPEHTEASYILMRDIEMYLDRIAFDFPCDICFPKLSVSALIKAVSPQLRDEYTELAEKVIDYMELTEVFDRKKLFFTVNMRSFVSDPEMELFSQTAISHGYQILMLEGFAHSKLSSENRLIIDHDLCEIG